MLFYRYREESLPVLMKDTVWGGLCHAVAVESGLTLLVTVQRDNVGDVAHYTWAHDLPDQSDTCPSDS